MPIRKPFGSGSKAWNKPDNALRLVGTGAATRDKVIQRYSVIQGSGVADFGHFNLGFLRKERVHLAFTQKF